MPSMDDIPASVPKETLIEALDSLASYVDRHCEDTGRLLDSLAQTDHYVAMKLLERFGYVRVESEFGKRIHGEWIDTSWHDRLYGHPWKPRD